MGVAASVTSSDYQIDRSNYPIVIVDNFLDPDALSVFNSFLSEADTLWGALNDRFWPGRILSCKKIQSEKVRGLLIENRQRIKKIIANEFGVEGRLYSDTLDLCRWIPGYPLAPHADAELIDGGEHCYAFREFSSVIYLNDDFAGGQIYFPNFDNFSPTITPGRLLLFRTNLACLHGVHEVTAGVRYTVASFFHQDPEKPSDKFDDA